MRILAISLLLLLAVSSGSQAQSASELSIEANVLVTRDSTMGHTESYVAVNPLDPNDIVGGTTTFAGTDGALYDKTYTSRDGGYTWNDTTPIEQRDATTGDPQTIFTNNGTALFATINLSKLRIDVYRSTDGGLTWHQPAQVPLLDHEVMAVDRSQSRYRGRIYLIGETTIHRDKSFMGGERVDYLFASDNDGRSFDRLSIAADGKSGGAKALNGGGVGAMGVDVLSDGTVVFNVARYDQEKVGYEEDYVATSADGGRTFGPEVPVGQWFLYSDNLNARQARYQQLQSEGDVSGQGQEFEMAVDRSTGAYRDRIYVVTLDIRSGAGRIDYRYSPDRGKTWSPARAVASQSGAAQFQPAIATNARGDVLVTWFSTLGDPQRRHFNAYAAISSDGGQSFSAPQLVTTATSMPKSAGNLEPVPDSFDNTTFFISAYSRWGAGGDYVGLAAGSDGVFHYYWPDARGTAYQIYSARLHAGDAPSAPASAGSRDVTKQVTMLVDPIAVNPATNEVDIPIRLQNHSKNTLFGPVTVEFLGLQNAQQVRYARIAPKAQILNAANGKRGSGATFDYSRALGSYGALPPGAVTNAVVWRFHLSDITDLAPIAIQARITAEGSMP